MSYIIYGPNSKRLTPGYGSLQFAPSSTTTNGYSIANSFLNFNYQKFTACFWLYYSTSPGNGFPFGCGSSSSGNGIGLEIAPAPGSGGPPYYVLVYVNNSYVNYNPQALTVGGWNFIGISGNGTTLNSYVRPAGGALGVLSITNTTDTGSGETTYIGNSYFDNFGFNTGAMSDFQLYNVPFTQQGFLQQSNFRRPISFAGLTSYMPLRNLGQTRDFVHGHAWTRHGSATSFTNYALAPPAAEVPFVRRAKFLKTISSVDAFWYGSD